MAKANAPAYPRNVLASEVRKIMRVFVLGGTGSIGSAVVGKIIDRGHEVVALARSETSWLRLAKLGAVPILGNIQNPEAWVSAVSPVDAVIHAACDFGPSMAEIQRHLLEVLISHLALRSKKARFIYTGGCWLFGQTGNVIATEESPFAPFKPFAWMVPQALRILESRHISGIVIHPAMVHGVDSGVFARFAHDAIHRTAVRVVASEHVRWPLVHQDDLGTLYALALEGAPRGSSYIGAAIEGFPVGRIARAFAQRFSTPNLAPELISPEIIAAEIGEWARGFAIDQQASGEKARCELGWTPKFMNPEIEIASLP